MSRRTCFPANEADLSKNLKIDVPLYAAVSRYLYQRNSNLFSSVNTGNLETATVAGKTGVRMKGGGISFSYWLTGASSGFPIAIRINPGSQLLALSYFMAPQPSAHGHGWFFELVDKEGSFDSSEQAALASSYGGDARQFKPFWTSAYIIAPPPADKWTHVTTVYQQDGTGIVYYDGIEKGRTAITSLKGRYYGIGFRHTASDGVNDSLAAFRQLKLWIGEAFSPDMVVALYEKESTELFT